MHWHRIIENTLHEFTRKGFHHELDKKTAKTFTLMGTGSFHRPDKWICHRFYRGKNLPRHKQKLCVPGLNCYSCPGAIGSCPIGSLQAVLGSKNYKFSFYVIGFLMIFGSLMGRFVCGWLCPFGLVQDLLHKIPFVKRSKKSHLTAICAI